LSKLVETTNSFKDKAMIQSNYSAFLAPYFRKLSDDQLAHMHAASLEILERTGVQLHLPEAVECSAAGHSARRRLGRIPRTWSSGAVGAPKRIAAQPSGQRVAPGRNRTMATASCRTIDVRTASGAKARCKT
jgi:trimethylamine:corrinoid methyltransferase-like protein